MSSTDDHRGGINDVDHDILMPGFRFHPTEEELIEFYLRRKVEGKPFNFELISYLDLYRYDPWELPALATIGEKEWYFYVPRDRKYRNGDRPNRVTVSGYWKATGADRTVKAENSRSIGLKKTLVFYSGKAPRGIRTSWIMNEYRLPLSETERYQKAEISLCRVYKRSGVDDSRIMSTKPSSSSKPSISHKSCQRSSYHQVLPCNFNNYEVDPFLADLGVAPLSSEASNEEDNGTPLKSSISNLLSTTTASMDELSRLVGKNYFLNIPSQSPLLPFNPTLHAPFPSNSDKLWDWNLIAEAGRDYN